MEERLGANEHGPDVEAMVKAMEAIIKEFGCGMYCDGAKYGIKKGRFVRTVLFVVH